MQPTIYHATRADLAALTSAVQPDTRLRTSDGQTYIVTDGLSILGGRMVRPASSPPGPGSITLAQLLARSRTLHIEP
ncbi:hypothetical protein [Streptomyces sp. NPDC047972]|uniref:hypothetical protein n=1 Tax=Streptomyces sp. NPDC047972 TaxID=3365493 RepID=UPI003711739D